MNNYSKIYWLTRLDNIQCALIILFVISIIALALYVIAYPFYRIDNDSDEDKLNYSKFYGKYKTIAIWFVISTGIILTFMPSKNDIILIHAGGKAMDYVQKDTSLRKIPYQTTAIISDYLDKTIKEMKK